MFGNKLEKLVSLLLVFLIPTQLAIHFWPNYAFVYGIRVDYLSPTIYFTDLLAIFLIISLVAKKPKIPKYINFLFLFAIVNIAFSSIAVISFFKWIKIAEFFLLGLYIRDHKKEIGERSIFISFGLSLFFFSLIGILQFFTNHSFGSEFYLLGARSFGLTTPGIALTDFLGSVHLRAYSTFPHPNALAGYLGVGIILLLSTNFIRRDKFFYFGLLVVVTCLLLTFSLSAGVGLVGVLLLFFLPTLKSFLVPSGIVFSFALFSMDSFGNFGQSYSERISLAKAAIKLFSNNFIWGVGLNNFIPSSGLRLLQPAHNIFLLMGSELGILGVGGMVYLFGKFLKSKLFLIIIFVFITGLFDHYWLTSQQNLLLLTFVFAMLN